MLNADYFQLSVLGVLVYLYFSYKQRKLYNTEGCRSENMVAVAICNEIKN